MITGLAALVGLFMVIGTKFFTTVQIQRLRRMVAESQATNSKIKTELRVAENNKAVSMQNLKTEERMLRTLRIKIQKNDETLASLKKK